MDNFAVMDELLLWGHKIGCKWPLELEFKYDKMKGIYAVCKQDCVRPVIEVPSDAIITNKLAIEYFTLNANEKSHANSWLKLLFAKMVFDKDPTWVDGVDISKKFHPYIQALPKLIHSPLVWNPSELETLLVGTNLGGSVKEKLCSIIQEWIVLIESREDFKSKVDGKYLINFENYNDLAYEDIYNIFVKPVEFEFADLVWLSFPAFLYSHLVFTTRAFPEYVIDKNANEFSVILLPILDLMNHNYNSKVQWFPKEHHNGTSFCYQCLADMKAGDELDNNYGGKGNEELLNGYGFVIDDNIFDTVALRIKLSEEELMDILTNYPDISLPTIDDYTTFAFDLERPIKSRESNGSNIETYKDGILYLINSTNTKPLIDLIGIFSYIRLSRELQDTTQRYDELAPFLSGIQMLKVALKQKLNGATSGTVLDEDQIVEMNDFRVHCSKVYRESQIRILKAAISSLKSIEKTQFREQKSRLLTIDKIIKYDTHFYENELTNLFEGQEAVFDSAFDLFVIWIIMKSTNGSFIKKYEPIKKSFETFRQQTLPVEEEEALGFHKHILNGKSDIDISTTLYAIEYVKRHVITRLNSRGEEDETILVIPL